MQARAYQMIDLLGDYGIALREPYSKHLRNGIFELRIKFQTDISRVLYFFFDGRRIILTNGFIKKSAKTPVNEITLAEKYRKDYVLKNNKREA